MIEYKIKKHRIAKAIERWSITTKIAPMLRDYDIPSLVLEIMDAFFPIHLTCGHQVADVGEIHTIERKEQQRDGSMARVSSPVCRDCKLEAEHAEDTKGPLERVEDRGTAPNQDSP